MIKEIVTVIIYLIFFKYAIIPARHVNFQVLTVLVVHYTATESTPKAVVPVSNIITKYMDTKNAFHVNGLVKHAIILIVAILAHIIPIEWFIILIIMVTFVNANKDMRRALILLNVNVSIHLKI